MKCILYWEYNLEDIDKVTVKNKEQHALMEKDPNWMGKYLFPAHSTGMCQGFSIVEVNQQQMTTAQAFWFPLMKLKFVPIIESSKKIEAVMKLKK